MEWSGSGEELIQSLRSNPDRYVDLFESAPVPYFIFDLHGRIVELNRAAAAWLGGSQAQLLGESFAQAARLDNDAAFQAHLMECAWRRENVSAELHVSPRHVRLESVAVRDPSGRPHCVRTVVFDVTPLLLDLAAQERRVAIERALCSRQVRLAAAQLSVDERAASGGSLEALLELVAAEAEALLGAARVAAGVYQTSDRPGEIWVGRKAPNGIGADVCFGGRVIGRLLAGPDDDRQLLEALAVRVAPALQVGRLRAREARDRERMQLLDQVSLALSESDYELVLARIAELVVPRLAHACMIYIVEDGRWRPSACAHVDAAQEGVLQALHAAARCGPANRATPAGQAAASRAVVRITDATDPRLTTWGESADLRELVRRLEPHSLLAVPVVLDGELLGAMVLTWCGTTGGRRYDESDALLAWEVAQRVALALANARLYQQMREAIRTREDMMAVVAHDLRSPLQAIELSSHMIASDLAGPGVGRLVDGIQGVAARMKRLVHDLLDGAALDSGRVTLEPRAYPLLDLIAGVLGTFSDTGRAQGIRLEYEVPAHLPPVRCDPERIEQLLTNLVENALKFTPAGGTIRVSARAAAAAAEIEVADTGEGIAAGDLEHLFERYWKGDAGGTGLGLYIAKRIAEAHGGSLSADSRLGVGSQFRLTLPFA